MCTMNRPIANKFLLLSVLLLMSFFSRAQINVDAVNKYWELTSILKQGKKLTDQQWNDFIAIDGNKTYAASEFTPDLLAGYRRSLEIVYMPQNDSLLQTYLRKGTWYVILAQRYKEEETQLKKYLADTVMQPEYFNKAYQYVYEYLPERARHPLPDPKLYYNCLSNDAVSYPNGMFYSLLSVVDNKRSKAGTLEAHELHHRLRPAMDLGGVGSKAHGIAAADTGLLWALSSIPNEGIADLIDKTWELQQPGDPQGITDWLLTPAPATIKSLDSLMRELAAGQSDKAPLKKYYRMLLQGTVGHMPGFYMARIIVNNGYKPLTFRLN